MSKAKLTEKAVKTRTTKAKARSGSLASGGKARVRRPDSNGMSVSSPRTLASKPVKPSTAESVETEASAERRLGVTRKTIRDWKRKGCLTLVEGLWQRTTLRQRIEEEKLKQLQLKNGQALQQLRRANASASEEVKQGFAALVVCLRHVVENICFRVTADPTMQAKIYAHLREALESESARLSTELGLPDGPTLT